VRVTIIGSYGYGNFGDEMMLDGVLAGIRSTMTGARVTVISGNSKETSKLHGVRSLDRGGSTLARLRRYWDLVKSDLFVVGGGNIRDQLPRGNQSSRPNALSSWLGQVLLAHEMGVPTMCYGISIGHILTPQGGAVLKDCLAKVDAISVRDSASAARVSELGVEREVSVTADAAFSVIPKPRRPTARKGVVLCLRHWYEKGNYVEDEEAFNNMIVEVAAFCDSFFEERHEPILLVPFKAKEVDNDSDTVVHRELLGTMRHKEGARLLEQVPDLRQALEFFVSARLVVGMRLHSIILATAVGTPWVSINYDPKVRAFAQYAGQNRFSLEVSQVSSQRLAELTQIATADEGAISSALNLASDKFRALERRNAEIAERIVQARPPASTAQKVVVRSIKLIRYKVRPGKTARLGEGA